MIDERENRTYPEPRPLHSQQATYDGYRSVRLLHDDIGLATTAYSYNLGYDEVQEAAERIALMWNLHLGETLEELRRRPLPPVAETAALSSGMISVQLHQKIVNELGRIIGDLQAELDKGKTP